MVDEIQIEIRDARKRLAQSSVNEQKCEELCRFFGAVSQRDTDRTVVRVFKVVATISNSERSIGSSEIARIEQINRLTALHHLKRLETLGLVENKNGQYFMRDFDDIFEEMEERMLDSMRRAKRLAQMLEQGNEFEMRKRK